MSSRSILNLVLNSFLIPVLVLLSGFSPAADADEPRSGGEELKQISLMQGELFQANGITGKGVVIAIIDAGFPGVDTHPGLAHLFRENRIAATWDFIRNRSDVYTGHPHGTSVLSCIAGVRDGQSLGLATGATFLLARTERRGEPAKEEQDWAQAVDWAIRNGANIIQSSIGYTYHRYFPEEMDGHFSMAAQAACRAVRAGVLLVNSMGNQGLTRWKILTTPADADSILSVGAVDPTTGIAESYSSVGPTSDGRLKPNVCASGRVLTLIPGGKARNMDGTSFASPMITGFAACLMEKYPDVSAQEIIRMMEHAGHLYPYFDYSHGFGVPQASRFFADSLPDQGAAPVIDTLCQSFHIQLGQRDSLNNQNIWSDYCYYHISDSTGWIRRYGVININPLVSTSISCASFRKGDVFRIFCNGRQASWEEKE